MPTRWVTAGVIAAAIAARVAAVLALQSHTVPRSTYEHGEIAENLLAGRGFAIRFLGVDGPTSQQAPVYPSLLAGCYALGGVATPTSLLILELGQAAIGGLLAWSVMALAAEALPRRPRVAVAAGLITAFHPTLVYAATHVQVAELAASLLTLTFLCAYRTGRTGSARDAALTGLAGGVLVLTDPILGLVAPGAAWTVLRGRGLRGALKPLALAASLAATLVTPWVIRNARVHHAFVPVKSTFGYAFWQGNCSLSQGTDKVVRASVDRALEDHEPGLIGWNRALWEARHEAGYIDDIALTDADRQHLARLSEPERSRWLFRKAIEDLQAEPLRYPWLCLKRLQYFVFFDETNPKTRSAIYRAGHLGLTALAVIGWCAAGAAARRRLAPTLLTAGLIATFHALTIVSARFHVPIEPLMAVWAAAALTGRHGSAVSREPERQGLGWLGSRLQAPGAAGTQSPHLSIQAHQIQSAIKSGDPDRAPASRT